MVSAARKTSKRGSEKTDEASGSFDDRTASGDLHADTLDLQRLAGNHAVNQLVGSGIGARSAMALGVLPVFEEALSNASSQSLDPTTRADMERSLGEDLSQVRIHNNSEAALSARVLGAKSYTLGNKLIFGEGSYAPGTRSGKYLLAHELAHVIQQKRGGGAPTQSHEVEANRVAEQASSGQIANVQTGAAIGSVQMFEDVQFGDAVKKELLDYWNGKLKRAKKPEHRARYQRYIDTIEKGERPTWKQSEEEMQAIYKQIGGGGQQVHKSGRRGTWVQEKGGFWRPESGSSVPDIFLSSSNLEVKNYSITNLDNLVSKLKDQIRKRAENVAYDVRQQGIILDFRGQEISQAALEALIARIEKNVGVRSSNIQVVRWQSPSAPNKVPPATATPAPLNKPAPAPAMKFAPVAGPSRPNVEATPKPAAPAASPLKPQKSSPPMKAFPTTDPQPRRLTAYKPEITPFSQSRENINRLQQGPVGGAVAGGVAEIVNQTTQAAEKDRTYSNAMLSSAIRTVMWWMEKGVYLRSTAVIDHYYPEDDEHIPVMANALHTIGPFDGLEFEKLSEPDQYLTFENWALDNLHNYDDFVRHFLQAQDAGLRRNGSKWEVLIWQWSDWHGRSYGTWEEDVRLTSFMEPIYQQLLRQSRSEIAEIGKSRLSYGGRKIIGVRRFGRSFGVQKAIYSPTQEGVPLFLNASIDFDFEPIFFELEGESVPSGYSLVAGADLNTHAALRNTRIMIPREQATIGVSSSSGFKLEPNVEAVALVKSNSLVDSEQAGPK